MERIARMNKKYNNFSTGYGNYLRKQRTKKFLITLIQISILIFVITLWELLAQLGIIDTFIMSSPVRIFKELLRLLNNNFMYHIGVTFLEALISFLIATIAGTIIAIILWWSEFLRKILDPYIVVLNSLPKIALGPIIIIWFGIGTTPIIVMAILIMIVITIISMLNSFTSCDENKVLLLKSMGANKLQILIKLILPNSLLEFISVLKINVGLTWVGTIMGEYLVSRAGLGHLIVYGGQVFNLDLVMTSTVTLCVLASLMYFLVLLLEKLIIKHREN